MAHKIIPFSILLFIFLTRTTQSAKILFNIPLTTISEQSLYTPFVNELASRGHQVTVLARQGMTYSSPNIKEIVPLNFSEYMDGFSDPVENRKMGWKMMINYDYAYNIEGCHRIYQNPIFLETFQQQKYDLIVTNMFFHGCLYGVLDKYQKDVPFILVISHPPTGYTHDLTGARMPTSFVPNPLFSVSDRMTFFERFWNTLLDHYFTLYTRHSYMVEMDKIARHYLGHDIPRGVDIERNFSLIFSNTHFTLTPPRPLTPDVVEVGGLHCREAGLLPKDLDNFLNGGQDGFIYFSFGSVLKGHHMSVDLKRKFLNVFGQLKQRVLWKYEVDDIKINNLIIPDNVMMNKWLPQQDILGHKNIRLFITHSGMFSLTESTFHGVPMLGIPIFIDQNMNIHQAVEKGYALKADILEILKSEQYLKDNIDQILTNKTYSEQAKKISRLFRDQLETPMERAVYWSEYLIRHEGAHHLRSAARQLNFFQYHSLDVISVLFVLILIISYVLKKIIVFIYQSILNIVRKCRTSGRKNNLSKKRR